MYHELQIYNNKRPVPFEVHRVKEAGPRKQDTPGLRWRNHLNQLFVVLQAVPQPGDDLTYQGLPLHHDELWVTWHDKGHHFHMCLKSGLS